MNIESFKQTGVIGKGGFGEVSKADGADGKVYAIKRIPKEKNQDHNIVREVKAGTQLSHKNIIHFNTHYKDDKNDYLIFEFIQGIDMFSYLQSRKMKAVDEKKARKIITQIAEAVKHCHDNKVIHMDIKLDNIMYNRKTKQATLIDFGLCDFITEEKGDSMTRRVGSPEYCPPELLTKTSETFSGCKVDVWCLGMVLYALLSCTFPFNPKKRKDLVRSGAEHPAVKFNFKISEKAKDLLSKMLAIDPEQRISMEQVLAHPWMNK